MKISKIDVARLQLDQACKLYLVDGDLVSILTLAGASEEMLGVLLRQRGESNVLQAVHDSEILKSPTRTFKQTADSANFVRNAVKHANDPNEVDVDFLPGDTYAMLARALDNYGQFAGDMTESMISALYKLQMAVGRGNDV